MNDIASAAKTPTRPRTSTLDRPALMQLARTEYDRFAVLLNTLNDEDWSRPTDCPGWDVRTMVSHVLGMAEMAASIRVGMRQMRAAKSRGGVFIDSLTAVQVDERVGMPSRALAERFAAVGPKAARARARTPGLIRRRRMPIPQPVGGIPEDWTIGYLIDTILTRDTWMHRIDISRATGRTLDITSDHDGVLVADVACEWAGRHQEPCQLELAGPAGGTWTFGEAGARLALDAIEFCRVLSGREPGIGLLATQVPF
jgi:uncharacterized protein (TIGR03083 family)